MLDDIRERFNEAGRLFDFRQEQLAQSNTHMLREAILHSGVIYFVLLVLKFISHLYRIPWTDAIMVPVYIFFFNQRSRLADAELSFKQVRLYSFIFFLCFLTGISVIDLFPVSDTPKVALFPIFLLIFSVYYMDRFSVIAAFEGVYVLVYELIAVFSGQFNEARLYTGVVPYIVSFAIYWSVLGIYTEERRDNRVLEEKSSKDGLTGLLNKVSAEEEMRHYMSHRKEGSACAMIMLDFDNFKHVNDAYGHKIGDDALRKFGEILRRNFRTSDILGRMGGDEFMVLAREPVSEDFLIKQLNSVLMELATARFGDAKGFTCSIGVAIDPQGYSFERLYQVCDDALYEAKARGKAQYIIWSTKHIVPQTNRIIYISSPVKEHREAVKKICGSDYIFIEGKTATESFNDISLYGEKLEAIYFDFDQPGITVSQIREYMNSRPLYTTVPVHDIKLELYEHKDQAGA